MIVKLHHSQKLIADDPHRFRVVCAGRRFGKSVLSQLITLQWATKNKGEYWVVSPSYRQGKEIHWDRGFIHAIPHDWIAKTNETELSITLKNGSVIKLKGAENPDSLRGSGIRGLVVDEIAAIRNWKWLWEEVLEGVISDYQAPVIFISTPRGYNHFYDLFMRGQGNDPVYKSFRFTSYDNNKVPGLAEEIDRKKRELSEDTFAQEYLADFRKATGLAFKPFDRAIHIIEPFDIPVSYQRARGFDFGSTDGTASVRAAIDTSNWNWFIETSYLDNHRTTEDHARAILSEDNGLGFVMSYGDPSGAQWMEDMKRFNVFIESASKEVKQGMRGWVENCVERVNELLRPNLGRVLYLPDHRMIKDAPKLFIFNTPGNEKLVKQIENLKWRETSAGDTLPILDESDDPTGFHYDLAAALRYLCVSFKPQVTIPRQDFSQWQI